MNTILVLIPAFPLLGAIILITLGARLPKPLVPIVGAGAVGLSALIAIVLGVNFIVEQQVIDVTVWAWINVGGLNPAIAFHLDALTMVFVFVITFVGFLIHIYSAEFMVDDDGYARFFAYLNLFVCSMLILVLADNFLLLYMGWEGVGLCSYLLIGFWYEEEKNGYAARKAFIVTRVGDTAMAVGLFMIFATFHTLNIDTVTTKAMSVWTVGSPQAFVIALLLLGGAVGKSAQLPLQTWLPDAMAGPSPVSALIHAATMVTAGVYLIARTHVIFTLAPDAQLIVGVVGALTLLIAGFSALTQTDLKRVLAYSTISQIGYMFLALGVGAWSAAIFHFMVHAFFKALLFLAAGAIIHVLHHEHDMFKMGGLRTKLPTIYWTFLVGAGSLAALPLITGGFYSKDQILWLALAGEHGHVLLYIAGLTGAFVTSVYTFRMVFVTFYGKEKTHVHQGVGTKMSMPLVILAFLSTLAGFIELPHNFAHVTVFSNFLSTTLPATSVKESMESSEAIIQFVAAVVSLLGVLVAYVFYIKRPELPSIWKENLAVLHHWWLNGWGFDTLYDILLVKPFVFIARLNKADIVDQFYKGITIGTNYFNQLLVSTQRGVIRWYVMGIVVGAIIMLTLSLFI